MPLSNKQRETWMNLGFVVHSTGSVRERMEESGRVRRQALFDRLLLEQYTLVPRPVLGSDPGFDHFADALCYARYGQPSGQITRKNTMKKTIELSEHAMRALSTGDYTQEAQKAALAALEPACMKWFRGRHPNDQSLIMTLGVAYVKAKQAALPNVAADIKCTAIRQWNYRAGEYIEQCK